MTTPIPDCPQPETPLRERALTDGQRQAEPKYSDAEINVLATECECDPSQAAVRYKTIAKVLCSLLAERAASRPSTPDKAGVSDADVEGAFKVMDEVFSSEFQTRGNLSDEDKAMAKRGIRAALEHFAPQSAEAVRDGERYQWLKMSAPAGFQYQLIRTPWTSWDSQIDAAMQEQSHD